MIKYVVTGLLVALLVFIYRTADYVGAFKDVEIQLSEEPAKNLIFKTHIGAYHKIVPVIEEVETWAGEKKIDCHLTFGEYLDNPDISEEDRLKSHGGCVVSEPAPELLQKLHIDLPPGYESKQIPAQKFVKAVFDGSPGIGPLKVYPKVQKFADKNGIHLRGSVIEVYEIHRDAVSTTAEGQSEEKKSNSPVKMTTTYYFSVQP